PCRPPEGPSGLFGSGTPPEAVRQIPPDGNLPRSLGRPPPVGQDRTAGFMDLIVRNASVVTDGLEMTADLGITNGVVTQIGRLEGVAAAQVIDAAGRTLLPGLVELGVSLHQESNHTLDCAQDFGAL